MLQTSARLLRLLSLLQARRFWSGSDLASRLEVTERTVRRDVDRLRSLGYPVDGTSGVAGGYQLAPGAVLPPLLLEDDEALAVSIGLGTAASSTVTGIEEAALRALVKLEHILPMRLRRRVNALRAAIVPLTRAGPSVDSVLLSVLASACRDREQVLFRYADKSSKSSDRTVEPQGLVHTGHRWYLVAWDVNRNDWRTFRVDRITGSASVAGRFVPRPPPAGDLKAYVSRSLSTSAYPFQASILFFAPIDVVAERVSPAAGSLERIDAKHCRLMAGAPSLDVLALWVCLIGVDFEVEQPMELVEHLRVLHARMGRALPRTIPNQSRGRNKKRGPPF
jgi:predicted DNA-binding transcriptional regulator YafY